MKRFAVGYMNAFDNELVVEIVQADTWQDAIRSHSKAADHRFEDAPLDEIKQEFFNQDAALDVVEIP